MIEGGNWWRANEIVMLHLTRRLETRYRCRDKAPRLHRRPRARARTAGPQSSRPSRRDATAPLAAGVDGEVLGRTTVRISKPIAALFRRSLLQNSSNAANFACVRGAGRAALRPARA